MIEKKKYSILIVDDEKSNIMVLSRTLAADYSVLAAKCGEDALEAARKYLPDLILLDIIMPDMDGYAVLDAIKASAEMRHIPVIFVAGLNDPEDEVKGLALGAVDFIKKPIVPDIIKMRVKKQLAVTEQLKAARSETANFKLASEAMKIALWTMDVVADDPVNSENAFMWSQEFRHMLGFTDENDFPNRLRSWSDRLHPEDKDKSVAAFAAHMNDYSGQTPYEIEYRLKNKNGEYRHYDGIGSSLRTEEGVPIRVSGYIRDITEKKLIEEALAKRDKMLRAVNGAAEVLLMAGEGDVFKGSLEKGMEIIGQSVGADCVELWQNESGDDGLNAVLIHHWVSEAGKKILPELPVKRFAYKDTPEWEARLSDGEHIKGPVTYLEKADQDFLAPFKIESVLVIPIFIDNGFWGFSCIDDCLEQRDFTEDEVGILRSVSYMLANAVNRDVLATAMRRAEIAVESNKAKSRFLATMSHEIRTPMNSIMGFSELGLNSPEGLLPPNVMDYFAKIKDSTRWLLNIVNDILDISKIESGKMELERMAFDLGGVISHCESVVWPRIEEKGLAFKLRCEAPEGKNLLGDPVRLYQALMNLLSNAVKFTETGTVELTAKLGEAGADFAKIYFEVKDSGIGMSREQSEKVFAPFIQADSSTTRNYGGTGLGLAITKNMVELMGGELMVESTLGVGTAFSFEIKFETLDASDELGAAVGQGIIDKPHFEGLVLVCDDNHMNQEVICEHLLHVGLSPVVAENGKIGVDMVMGRLERGETPFDLVFMDMYMPVMDGMEAASRIMALNEGTPIIAMTANIMESDLENYRNHGMPYYLGKPFTSQELWRILLKYLKPLKQDKKPKDKEVQRSFSEDELQLRLMVNFVKNNQTKVDEIKAAIAEGDIKLAHRLAHTLKGNAGLIGKTGLKNAAQGVEAFLKKGSLPVPEGNMNHLAVELEAVLVSLRPLLEEPRKEREALSEEETLVLFEQLAEMLENINPECVNLLESLRAVKGSEELCANIEDYDFETAAGTLAVLRKNWSKE